MNDAATQHDRLAVRASDDEREQTVAVLQRSFADGRLALAELEERASAAYAARTRAQLRDLTADLPADEQQPSRLGIVLDRRLLCVLLCVCPPAGLAYWLLSLRQTTLLRAWLMNARPWRQLLAGAIVAGAGAAVQGVSGRGVLAVLSHLAGAVLVSAGVIFALPAISGPLHRTWVIARRAFPARGSQRPLTEQSGPHPGDGVGDRTPEGCMSSTMAMSNRPAALPHSLTRHLQRGYRRIDELARVAAGSDDGGR